MGFYFRVGVIFAKKTKTWKLPPRENFHVYIILLVLKFMDQTLHENQENWYPLKIKPYLVWRLLPLLD